MWNSEKDPRRDAIVEAIMRGQYSWACVLVLRYWGYNPSHYLPIRTYSRLIADNKKGNPPSTKRRGAGSHLSKVS